MKHLFSHLFLAISMLFGVCVAFFSLFEPAVQDPAPDLPQSTSVAISCESSDAVAIAASNPAVLGGADIHRNLAGLNSNRIELL